MCKVTWTMVIFEIAFIQKFLYIMQIIQICAAVTSSILIYFDFSYTVFNSLEYLNAIALYKFSVKFIPK